MPSLAVRQNLFILPLALAAVLAAVSTSSAARNPSHGPQAPSNTAPPTVSGSAIVGATLSSSIGVWSGSSISYTVTWQRCDASGAGCASTGVNASTYAIQAVDAGATLRVIVLATNKSGATTASSAPTAVVAGPPAPAPAPTPAPVNTAAPQIAGTAVVGQSLTASAGSWNPSSPSVGFNWSRCDTAGANCARVAGATAPTFTLGSTDQNARMRVVVTASDSGGATSVTSAATAVVTAPVAAPLATSPVTITGTTQVGQTLAMSQGTWSGSPTAFAYQWQRCDSTGAGCAPIAGAGAQSYVLATADAGQTLRGAVTASNAGGSTVSLSAASAVVTNPPAPTASASAGSRFGVAAGGALHNYSSTDLNHYFDLLQSAHVGWIRFDINWNVIQNAGPASYNWTPFDNVVRAATAHGIKSLGIILFTPAWARPSGTGSSTPPTNLSDYAAFAGVAAKHYGALGVHAYEIWNEPNIVGFWSPGPDPARYTQMLKLAYAAVKQADSSATVISAGLSGYGVYNQADSTHMNPITYLEKMYASGAKSSMDGVGWHPYAYPYGITYEAWSGWSQMNQTSPSARSVMIANGDGAKQIWPTEFGEPTGTASQAVSEATQASYVTAAYAALKGVSWAGPAFLYSGWDNGTDLSNVENNFGIIHHDWSLKPAYTAYAAAASAG